MICTAIVTVITVTFATQYLMDIVRFDLRLTEWQKFQQDKLLIRQMILLDYINSKSKKFTAYGTGFKIDDTSYIMYPSSRKIFEFYKHSTTNTRPEHYEIISSQVKNLVIQQNTIVINFKHPQSTPLVINCASQIERE